MSETTKKDCSIAVKDIYEAFKNDFINAEREYINKSKLIRGTVTYIGPDIYGLPSVELSEKENKESQVICVFPFSDYLKLLKVSKNQEITVLGKIVGIFDKSTIVIKNCQIVKQ